ncbi:hypothetical protein D3C72_1588250 [compost metagenome]
MRARQLRRAPHHRVLVDVVAEEHHQVQVFLPHLPVCRIVALFPALAGSKREADARRQRIGRRRGAGARGSGHRVAMHETVEVPTVRAQPADFHMDGVAELRQGLRAAAADDPPECLVFGHFPLDCQRALQCGDATGIGLRRARDAPVEQAGPQHESVGSGRAARHAKREQVALAQCGRSCPAGQVRGEAGGRRQMQKGSSLHASTVGSGDRGRLKGSIVPDCPRRRGHIREMRWTSHRSAVRCGVRISRMKY